jgi:hypothetical protein
MYSCGIPGSMEAVQEMKKQVYITPGRTVLALQYRGL